MLQSLPLKSLRIPLYAVPGQNEGCTAGVEASRGSIDAPLGEDGRAGGLCNCFSR